MNPSPADNPTIVDSAATIPAGAELEVTVEYGAVPHTSTVRSTVLTMGSDADCSVHIPAEGVSRRHARISAGSVEWVLEDMGSSNGTLVGGQRITRPTRLWPGQRFQIGTATVQVRRARGTLTGSSTAMRFLPEEKRQSRRYDIACLVAQGGMGAVLDARDGAMERKVAMKVMLDPGDPEALARFIAEARITGQLEHPNIVPIHDIGVDENGHAFYTMKFVRGVTLADVFHGLVTGDAATVEKYPLPVLLTVFQKVCDALAFAHSRGVIHRDLKPANIMLGDYGEVLVMDWGLAKLVDTAPASAATPASALHSSIIRPGLPQEGHSFGSTLTGSIMGTPQYMAPEQARGEIESLDARTDLYSLGAILFELLHLRPPFSDGAAMEIVRRVSRGEVEWTAPKNTPAPAPARREIPASLLAVCRKALALAPGDRYPRVAALQADLTAWQNGFATRAENAGAWTQIKLLIRRHKAAALGTAAVLTVGALLGSLAVIKGNQASSALNFLQKATPTFTAQAENLVEERKLPEAIEKLDFALAIEPGNPDHHLRRAHLLQASVRLPEAADAYRKVLSLRKEDKSAETNLALCLKLTGDPPRSTDPDAQSLRELYDNIRSQGRTVDSVALGERLGLGSKATEDAINLALADWLALPEWKKLGKEEKPRVRLERDGSYALNLSRLPIHDLTPFSKLEGLPIAAVNISDTLVSDFTPLQKLPLLSLTANGCPVTDLGPLAHSRIRSLSIVATKVRSLEPLRNTPLVTLNFGYTKIPDLTPLRGLKITDLSVPYAGITSLAGLESMPLRKLDCSANPLADIAPLEGLPLEFLSIAETWVSDLTPLRRSKIKNLLCWKCGALQSLNGIEGLPLDELNIHACRGLKDISALRGMKLRYIDLRWLDSLKDYSPITESEEVVVPPFNYECATLRGAKISILQDGFGARSSPERWWADFDAYFEKQNAGNAEAVRIKAVLATAGWTGPEVTVRDDGTLSIAAGKSKLITDLSPLRGLNISQLKLPGQPLADLSPLKGMALTVLDISSTRVADLTPLRDMPLKELYCRSAQVADLSPLRGMPIEKLQCQGTPVSDLSPLLELPALRSLLIPETVENQEVLRPLTKLAWIGWAGDQPPDAPTASSTLSPEAFWKRYDTIATVRAALVKAGVPLKERQIVGNPKSGVILYLDNSPLTDLSFLQPLPIDRLKLTGGKVSDLSPLKGSKIKILSIDKTQVTDLRPLLEMPALESLILPAKPASLDVLRQHPTLRYLGYEADWDSSAQRAKLTVQEFWKRHDAKK